MEDGVAALAPAACGAAAFASWASSLLDCARDTPTKTPTASTTETMAKVAADEPRCGAGAAERSTALMALTGGSAATEGAGCETTPTEGGSADGGGASTIGASGLPPATTPAAGGGGESRRDPRGVGRA